LVASDSGGDHDVWDVLTQNGNPRIGLPRSGMGEEKGEHSNFLVVLVRLVHHTMIDQ
jgi:hypothetical protein